MLFTFPFNHEERRGVPDWLIEELEEILSRRKSDRRPGCHLMFHNDGNPIAGNRKCWRSACVTLGFGAYSCRDCRDCRDVEGTYTSELDVDRKCPAREVPEGLTRNYAARIRPVLPASNRLRPKAARR